jgi:hypothetical protein
MMLDPVLRIVETKRAARPGRMPVHNTIEPTHGFLTEIRRMESTSGL